MSVPGFVERLGVTRALVYTMLGRTWSILAGPFSLIFIARFLSKDEQGFYFTFWSVVGLWVFFDLGLTSIIVQFASHERVLLRFVDGGMRGDERAGSARHRCSAWPAAAWRRRRAHDRARPACRADLLHALSAAARAGELAGPWIPVVFFTALNVTVGPFASILKDAACCRTWPDAVCCSRSRQVSSSGSCWSPGASLHAAAVSVAHGAFGASWIVVRHHRLFRILPLSRRTGIASRGGARYGHFSGGSPSAG